MAKEFVNTFEELRHRLDQLTDHGSQSCHQCLEHRRLGMKVIACLEAERKEMQEEALMKYTQHSIPAEDSGGHWNVPRPKRLTYMRTDSGKWRRIFDANRRPDCSYFYVFKGFPVRVPWLVWVMCAPLGESVDYK